MIRIVRLIAACVVLTNVIHGQDVQRPTTSVAFHNVDVFDGTRKLAGVTVLVEDGMIRSVGAEITIPPSAEVIDGRGKTLLPGLIDSHTHLGEHLVREFLQDALAFGVTTELEMGGSAASLKMRKEGCSGCADFLTAGTVITAPGGHPTQMAGSPMPMLSPTADVQVFVDQRIAEGSDYIKIIDEHQFPTFSPRRIEDIVIAAHRRNKLAVAHVGSQKEAVESLQAGVDGIAHVFADSPPDPKFAQMVLDHHAFVITTLTVFESLSAGGGKRWWELEPNLNARLTPSMKTMLAIRLPASPTIHLGYAEQTIALLKKAGVPLLAGTDSPVPGIAHGVSLHRELELLVQSGLSPSEALTAATYTPATPARQFGLHDRGRITVGLRADLILVGGDPTTDIQALRNIIGVWKLGVRVPR
ncbi:amidohydrolase family protein [Terriglobus sp. RCC_193]|uniref:amidohydrolase family protein n=1 Tax=Terriglobus sp. RCC_193 TaxID=3239218 RepID=UPI00352347DA